ADRPRALPRRRARSGGEDLRRHPRRSRGAAHAAPARPGDERAPFRRRRSGRAGHAMRRPRMSAARRLLTAALLAGPLAFGAAGCETMDKLNPFVERQPPLPGERKPLFPEGVPGVDFGAPPPQPTNSNIPITPSVAGEELPPAGEAA